MASIGILQNGAWVMLNINTNIGINAPIKDAFKTRSDELREMLTGYPTTGSYRIPSGTIVNYEPSTNMYNVKWTNAASLLANKDGYLMYPNELISLDDLPLVEIGPAPEFGKGGGKKARRSRKSRKSRKVRKSYKKYRKSRKVRKSRRARR